MKTGRAEAIGAVRSKERNTIIPGVRVRVTYAMNRWTNDPAKKLDGFETIVKRKKWIPLTNSTFRPYYELYGAESDFGIPYAFCEEDLTRI